MSVEIVNKRRDWGMEDLKVGDVFIHYSGTPYMITKNVDDTECKEKYSLQSLKNGQPYGKLVTEKKSVFCGMRTMFTKVDRVTITID